jgi:hypothetical protein
MKKLTQLLVKAAQTTKIKTGVKAGPREAG